MPRAPVRVLLQRRRVRRPPATDTVTEQTPTVPESPYGESKLVSEWILHELARAQPGFRGVSLRYFNVVGSADPDVPGSSSRNLFPLIIDRLQAGEEPQIFGDDYPTPDGICVRDCEPPRV